ncbi:uncharacterized protein EDB91DRAFT_1305156 [Suillus paluster]|uniref:uncharacterized protein n=1 Tax=Suillus paluster TaxID=48578 RepID=UPI001B85CB44|nr:uncharacterized protein EDB91DRAFT_1305156 [Suillus paluster]KAG1717928.1 hypothetical protein EDB91DRAFT_1305156 [Suillus paluster]
MPSHQDLQRIRNNLTESKILTDNEKNVFEPLGHIIAEILPEVLNCGVSFIANPNVTPLSQCNNTSRPDGYLVLSNKKTQPKIHWFDIAVPFEFKKAQDRESLRDDEQKIIWSLHSIMHKDLLRCFAFGITMEDTQLRLWLSNRAFLVVTEPINFFENIDGVISLFYTLGSASASSTMKELRWDPTVEWIHDGEGFQYKFTIRDEVFTTTRELATYGADSMVGHGTRVYEATDAEGKKVAVKDSWRAAGHQSEGEILENILASCVEKLQAEELADAKRHFVGVWLWKDVIINDTPDETLDPMFAEEHNHTWHTGDVLDSGQLSTFLPTQLGIIARKDTVIPRRVHTRTIFLDVGVALKDVTSLANNLSCLSGTLLALHYMHKAGWVHRDFSIGNTIWVGGVGKLGDFEYAKEIDSNTSNDVRMGTMHFMAVEVESQNYLFLPRHAHCLDQPTFRMNFLHDIESIWWAFTWILFYHTDTKMANADHSFDAHAQLKEYQVAFPGFKLENLLSKTCFNVCSPIIPNFAAALQDGYERAEANFPFLALDDALLNDMHTKAAAYLNDAQRRAGGIELCPLSNLLKQKRPRPGDETLLLPKNQGKKARYA